MDYSNLIYKRLIELILEYNDTQAFEEFYKRTQDIVDKACGAFNRKNISKIDCEDFRSFVLSWAFEKKKFSSLLKKYELEENAGRLDDEEILVRSYYFKIVYSGCIAYRKELNPEYKPEKEELEIDAFLDDLIPQKLSSRSSRQSVRIEPIENFEYFLSDGDTVLQDIEKAFNDNPFEKLLSFLFELKTPNRIPVWLTFLVRQINLPQEDILWLAELNEITSIEVNRLINTAIEDNQGKSYATTSDFIGELMQEKKNTISMRVRRTIDKLSVIARESES